MVIFYCHEFAFKNIAYCCIIEAGWKVDKFNIIMRYQNLTPKEEIK